MAIRSLAGVHATQFVFVGAAAALTVRCAPSASVETPGPEIVLECTAGDIRHELHVRPVEHAVEDVSFTPAKAGVADISDAAYLLRFEDRRDHYELQFQIDRATGAGMRRLFDDEQQVIHGHGGTDPITCIERQPVP